MCLVSWEVGFAVDLDEIVAIHFLVLNDVGVDEFGIVWKRSQAPVGRARVPEKTVVFSWGSVDRSSRGTAAGVDGVYIHCVRHGGFLGSGEAAL